MACCIHCFADLIDPRARARRGFIVHDADSLNRVRLVLLEVLLNRIGVGTNAPICWDDFRFEPKTLDHVAPKQGKLPRLNDQHTVTR